MIGRVLESMPGKVWGKAPGKGLGKAPLRDLGKAPGCASEKVPGSAPSEAEGCKGSTGTLAAHFISNVAGILTYYSIGIAYLALILDVYLSQSVSFYRVVQVGLVPFIVPDLVKALIAAFISRALASAGIRPQR